MFGNRKLLRRLDSLERAMVQLRDAIDTKEVRAEAFVLQAPKSELDEGKRVRATLTTTDGEPVLTLLDGFTDARVTLHIHEGGPRLALYDFRGTCRAELTLNNDAAEVVLRSSKGDPRIALSQYDITTDEVWRKDGVMPPEGGFEHDRAELRCFGADGKSRVSLGWMGDAAHLQLSRLEESDGIGASVSPLGSLLVLHDVEGRMRIRFMTDTAVMSDPAPKMEILATDEEAVLFRAPAAPAGDTQCEE